MAITCQGRKICPPSLCLPVLSPMKICLLFSLLPPYQVLEELVVALHDAVLSSNSGTGSLGSSWDFTLGKWNQCKDPSLCSFIQPKHGLSWELVFRWASSTKGLCTVMVLFSTLAPPCQILLQWGQPRSGWGWIPLPARGKQKTTHTAGPLGTQNLAIVAQNPVETQICPGSCQQEQPWRPKNHCSTSP